MCCWAKEEKRAIAIEQWFVQPPTSNSELAERRIDEVGWMDQQSNKKKKTIESGWKDEEKRGERKGGERGAAHHDLLTFCILFFLLQAHCCMHAMHPMRTIHPRVTGSRDATPSLARQKKKKKKERTQKNKEVEKALRSLRPCYHCLTSGTVVTNKKPKPKPTKKGI